jgi:predicted DCC family thiol-disulfide oxidoreductase YuxK
MPDARDTLYYDGACGMCRGSVKWLRRLDWLGRLEFVDSTAVRDEDLPVSRERSMEGIPMRTRGGRALVGFPAMRRALAQTPLGAPPALAFYLPGLSAAGEAAYNAIARRRRRGAACGLPGGGER